MTPTEVISTLKARGVELWQEGGVLRCRARLGALTEQEKAVLNAHRDAIIEVLCQPLPNRTDPPDPGTTTPFNNEALVAVKAGAGCWLWSGTLAQWIFVVRDDERRRKAESRGINPGCIWTLPEITGVKGMPPEALRAIAKIRRKLDGTVQPGLKPERWADALSPLEAEVEA